MSSEHERARVEASQAVWQRMGEFIKSGARTGYVTNYILEGPISDSPTQFTEFAGIFPTLVQGEESQFVIVSGSETPRNAHDLRRKILSLQVPDRHKIPNPALDENAAVLFDRALASVYLPSVVMGFGCSVQTGEEVVALFATLNRSPENALKMIQDRVRSRMHKLN